MRKNSDSNEEDRIKDSTDTDRYSLDNLDLLNLRVSFSSDATHKSARKSRNKTRTRRKNSETLSRGDYITHTPQRCEHYRNRQTASGDHTPSNTCYSSSPRKTIKSDGRTLSEQCGEPNDKSVLLLYTNRQPFSNPSLQKPISEESEFQRNRAIVHAVNIHSVNHNISSMAQRSARKKTHLKEPHSRESGTFPFKITPSGNFKVNSQQVVFESQKLSVLVADPEHTKVNIHPENKPAVPGSTPIIRMNNSQEFQRGSVMESIMGQNCFGGSLGSLIASTAPIRREKESSEYEGKVTDQILDPELNLHRLGYTAADPIDWQEVKLPEKTNLYLELYQRITNYTNADCKVYIDNEEFNCHLIVLQCYSEVFDEYVAVKKVELPSDKVSTGAFAFIYEWMITGEPACKDLNRESVLDIFNASKYLKIKDLTEQCWAFIDNTDVFAEDTAFLLYTDAKQKYLDDVRELMLPRIQKFFLMLVSSQDWLDLEKVDVVNFLGSNYINVNCEMEVFMSAIRWLKHKWDDRQQYVADVMECIRFGNIAPWQLVDIKRNPENPEFLKLTSLPAICKMIDDGLAFVIIKYWYGQENDDFQHWNNILGLQEPPTRNWSGMDKTYFTYREFLIYLDQYRRSQMIEKSKPKDKRRRTNADANTSPKQSMEKVPPRIPTMDEFLSSRKGASTLTRQRAAVVIQSAYRGHLIRKILASFVPKLKLNNQVDRPTSAPKSVPDEVPWIAQKNINVMSMFNQSCEAKNLPEESDSNTLVLNQKNYTAVRSLFNADRESVLVFGGIDPHNNYGVARKTGKDVFKYIPDSNIWEYVGELPEPRHHHSVAFLKGRVYLCGGADPRDDVKGKSVVVDTVWSFEPVKKSWCNEGSMCTPRKNFGLIASNLSMYAIGGQDRLGRTLASVEKFFPETGSWEFQAPLKNPRMGVACTKYRDYIWAAGGMSGSRKTPLSDCVECYDTRRNQWTEIAKLRFPRCFGRMFSMSDRLYLIGGAGKTSDKKKTTSSVATIDVWDPVNMEWKHQTDMAIPRHGHSIAYLGTQILIIGGVTTLYMRALSNTECYCTERGTWVRGIACLPTTLSGHAAVTLPPASLM